MLNLNHEISTSLGITIIIVLAVLVVWAVVAQNYYSSIVPEVVEDEITDHNKPQVITFNPPEVMETNSVVLRGKILDTGGVDIDDVSWEFECGRTQGVYTAKLEQPGGSRGGEVPCEYWRSVIDLDIATTYYCRAKSCNSIACGYGKEISFQTGAYYEEKGKIVDTAKKIVTTSSGKNINITNDTEMYCFDDLRKCSLNEICSKEICAASYLPSLGVLYYVENNNYYAHKIIYAPQ